jgi:hypothetical protein
MEGIVREILAQCASRGVMVSHVLAAFVSKSIILEGGLRSTSDFCPDKALTNDSVNMLIDRSVERLLEDDNPRLETIKMQVEFDSSYLDYETQAAATRQQARLKDIRRNILGIRPRDATDFEAHTALHRHIFNYLLRRTHEGIGIDRATEKEVASALESIFPRISVGAFAQLSQQEKNAQLEELCDIVLGIRLFNKAIGKGGDRIPDVEKEVVSLLSRMEGILVQLADKVESACAAYQDVLVDGQLRSSALAAFDRLKSELANRHQFLAYVHSLQEDVLLSGRKVSSVRSNLEMEIAQLQQIVGNRTSVPKEYVYPKFDAIAKHWLALRSELRTLQARSSSLDVLLRYELTFLCTLPVAKPGGSAISPIPLATTQHLVPSVSLLEENDPTLEEPAESTEEEEDEKEGVSPLPMPSEVAAAIPDVQSPLDESGEKAGEPSAADAVVAGTGEGGSAVVLTVQSSVEFMQLPLEYQGFCPWTVAHRHGWLTPGRPELGVVQYRNAYYVFAHEDALLYFLRDPGEVIRRVTEEASRAPELIHLLRLQKDFPDLSISRIAGEKKREAPTGLTERQDAGTSTPLHFVEKCLDPSYSWNEWELRRRALQIAGIRKCTTTSQQTNASHFRREGSTQVHLPQLKGTQTRRSKGTSSPKKIQYFCGLRGDLPRPLLSSTLFRPELMEVTYEL